MLKGADEAMRSFKRLKEAAKPRVMRSALNAALTPVLKEVRAAAPIGDEPHKTYKGRVVAPGFLSRNIKKSTKVSRDKKRVFGSVKPAPEAWYGSLPEYGGVTRNYEKDPWFHKAAARGERESRARYFEKLSERIEKEFRK